MNGPLEFRTVTQPPHDARDFIPAQWARVITANFHPDEDSEEEEEEEPVYWPWTVAVVVIAGSLLLNRFTDKFKD